jgi:hypothetical protein
LLKFDIAIPVRSFVFFVVWGNSGRRKLTWGWKGFQIYGHIDRFFREFNALVSGKLTSAQKFALAVPIWVTFIRVMSRANRPLGGGKPGELS